MTFSDGFDIIIYKEDVHVNKRLGFLEENFLIDLCVEDNVVARIRGKYYDVLKAIQSNININDIVVSISATNGISLLLLKNIYKGSSSLYRDVAVIDYIYCSSVELKNFIVKNIKTLLDSIFLGEVGYVAINYMEPKTSDVYNTEMDTENKQELISGLVDFSLYIMNGFIYDEKGMFLYKIL